MAYWQGDEYIGIGPGAHGRIGVGKTRQAQHQIADPARWLARELPAGARVACDPRLHSLRWYENTAQVLAAAGLELVADSDNLVDRCWLDRPAPEVFPALLLGEQFSGESSLDKRRRIAAEGIVVPVVS